MASYFNEGTDQLHNSGDEGENDGAEHDSNGPSAAFQNARQCTRAPLQVEADVQVQNVSESVIRYTAACCLQNSEQWQPMG